MYKNAIENVLSHLIIFRDLILCFGEEDDMCAVKNNDKFIYYINNQYKNLSNVINDVIENRSMVEVILSDEELKNEFNAELKLLDTTKPFIDLISCKDISNKNYPIREDFF